MYAQLYKKGEIMSDHIIARHTLITISEQNIERALGCLIDEYLEDLIISSGLSDKEAVKTALEIKGFCVRSLRDGLMILDKVHGKLNIKEDLLLCDLVGIIQPGCCITGYSDDGAYWQVRYYEDSREFVYGKVLFPLYRQWTCPTEIETVQ